jgi:acyl-CoA thioesterase YciA
MPPATKHAQGRPPAIRVLMMPRDTNAWGTIFGGIILSYIDQAGAVEAHEIGCNHVVTVAMKEVEFHEPVHVGDLVSFYTDLLGVGSTSVRVKVTVEAQRRALDQPVEHVLVTEAEVVYVNIDREGKPLAIPARDSS